MCKDPGGVEDQTIGWVGLEDSWSAGFMPFDVYLEVRSAVLWSTNPSTKHLTAPH